MEITAAPVSAAFNRWSRPGWTTYAVGQLNDGFEPLYRELKKHGNPPWAGAEANAWFHDSLDWETYMGWHFNHGAVLMAVNYGATGTELPSQLHKSAFSPAAIAAYRKFLQGGTLKERRVSTDQSLKAKMAILQAGFQSWQRSGRDPSPIVKEVTERLQFYMNQGKKNEAEAVIDAGIKKLGVKAAK